MNKIKSALISVFHKEGLDEIVKLLANSGVTIYSTGGTLEYIEQQGVEAISIESLTDYPSIFGGRVKTLHPKVFGGILARQEIEGDRKQLEQYEIPVFDLVIVDLYPFEQSVAEGADHQEIIEKIDIGGISLIRAAAKNYVDTVVVSCSSQYEQLQMLLESQECATTIKQRHRFAAEAFLRSSSYDNAIFDYFNKGEGIPAFRVSYDKGTELRYGENPHQEAMFFGELGLMFEKLNGKDISYNNMLDIDAALNLIEEFDDQPTFAILKHNNACGVASRPTLLEAWEAALSSDPVSAFGGVLICNKPIDKATAEEVDKLFCEVVIAPEFEPEALELLKSKENRIILKLKSTERGELQYRSLLNGVAVQERDNSLGGKNSELKVVTKREITAQEKENLLFANAVVKHSKSNAIVLAKDKMLLASGMGQTSRVDALRHAIEKAKSFGFDLKGAVMASDAFFPFPDCVEIAHKEGIECVIQPGGSIRDQESIDYCDKHNMAMVTTSMRHFKH